MKYSRIRNVLAPTRGTEKSAGIDFYMPLFDEKFINDLISKNYWLDVSFAKEYLLETKKIMLQPQERILIPSGIKVNIPKGHVLIGFNKSGVSSKKGLDFLACVVDEDYQGEVHISLVNTGNDCVEINEHEKITQWVLLPVNYSKPEEVKLEELYLETTERGAGGFGSTDKKE
jgi:dUTP pyrophosphatase